MRRLRLGGWGGNGAKSGLAGTCSAAVESRPKRRRLQHSIEPGFIAARMLEKWCHY